MIERWWILTGGFRWEPANGGELYSGPYSTREDAFTARRKLEEVTYSNSLFIEAEQIPDDHACSVCGDIHEHAPRPGLAPTSMDIPTGGAE